MFRGKRRNSEVCAQQANRVRKRRVNTTGEGEEREERSPIPPGKKQHGGKNNRKEFVAMISAINALLRLHELQYSTSTGMRPDRDRLQAEMDRCRASLPAAVLQRYENLQRRYGSRALSTLERNVCKGCFITQPTTLKEVAEDIYVCEQCGRLMYDPEGVINYEVTMG